jgi:hypothetical protein
MTKLVFKDLDADVQRQIRERLGIEPVSVNVELLHAMGVAPEKATRHYSYEESRIQRRFIERVRIDPRTRDLVIAAVPNGARRSKIQGGRLKAEGMLAGYPDVLVDEARGGYHGLRFEFKQPGGRVSESQSAIAEKLSAAGFLVIVTDDEIEAFEHLLKYLNTHFLRRD